MSTNTMVKDENSVQVESDKHEEEHMSFFEFIKSVHKFPCQVGDKCEQCCQNQTSEQPPQMKRLDSRSKQSNGTEKVEKSTSRDTSVERKTSEGSISSKIIPPPLRKMAYNNRRQETFHSLQMHVDRQPVAPSSLSGGNSPVPIVESHHEDLLTMPSIESLRVSETNGGRVYQKVQSDPSLLSKKSSIKSEVKLKKKRTLHTIEQPDGSIMGYCTEEVVPALEEHEAEA
uniref:Uncharacterized protein n=1 Tax=Acrobeloides nanus TaxID=290746 RepID=A0A914C0P2_9BILA